jgi:hypothetical protein
MILIELLGGIKEKGEMVSHAFPDYPQFRKVLFHELPRLRAATHLREEEQPLYTVIVY